MSTLIIFSLGLVAGLLLKAYWPQIRAWLPGAAAKVEDDIKSKL